MVTARKIGFISQSGNVAKTSLAYATAIECENNKIATLACDLDVEHRTLTEFHEGRNDMGLSVNFDLVKASNATEALNASGDEQIFIIDCPSRATEATIKVAQGVDLVVQPTSTNKKDLDLAIKTAQQLVASGVSAKKLLFVITRASTQARIREATEYLRFAEIEPGVQSEDQSFTILATAIYEKPSYETAMNDGFSMLETQYDSLNTTARSVVNEILTQLLRHD
jgi:cellulose biosynthesis protein BcsQ